MVEKPFDPAKPARTRSPHYESRILCTDGGGDRPIIGAFRAVGGNPQWNVIRWPANGLARLSGYESGLDLINIPEKRRLKCDLAVCKRQDGSLEASLFAGDPNSPSAPPMMFAFLRIDREVEKGEGLYAS